MRRRPTIRTAITDTRAMRIPGAFLSAVRSVLTTTTTTTIGDDELSWAKTARPRAGRIVYRRYPRAARVLRCYRSLPGVQVRLIPGVEYVVLRSPN